MTYNQWIAKVEAELPGVSLADLPDANWQDYFEADMKPREAVFEAVEEGFLPEQLRELMGGEDG